MKTVPTVILLDTNVLYHAQEYGIHIEEAISRVIQRDYEIFVHSMVQQEIINDLTQPNKKGRRARLAVELMTEFENYDDDREYSGTDTALIETAKRVNGVVFTFDKELRKRCQDQNIPVLTYHYRGNIQLVGYLA